jgi:microcystin-dependent protein
MGKSGTNEATAEVIAIINNTPIGTVMPYMGLHKNLADMANRGWLPCDGTCYNIADQRPLYDAIENAYGGNASTFYVPDLRGMFVRGCDEGTGRDPDAAKRTEQNPGGHTGNNVGTLQGHQFAKHMHTTKAWDTTPDVLANLGGYFTPPHAAHNFPSSEEGGNETRPINVAAYYIIFAGLPAQ